MRTAAFILALAALALPGCKVGGPSRDDPLRQRVVIAERDLARAQAENAELRSKLAESARASGLDPEAAAARPALASIAIDAYTGPLRNDPSIFRVYLAAKDGRNRPFQLTGTLTAEVATPDGRVVTRTLTPIELRDAWRAGFLGTFYEIDLTGVPASPAWLARVRFADATTGTEFLASRQTQQP